VSVKRLRGALGAPVRELGRRGSPIVGFSYPPGDASPCYNARMSNLRLRVLSLRYSSWSMRPWLALAHAGADFATETVEVALGRQTPAGGDDARLAKLAADELRARRAAGSVTGLFPVLHVDGTPIHESLAICEWVNEAFPDAGLLPRDPLARARARSIACEMATAFANLRTHLSCHLFARVPAFVPNVATRLEIDRVFEIWRDALDRSGGPFLFGRFGIADAMYFPVVTRFRTYGVAIPDVLAPYVAAVEALPAVAALVARARTAPRIPVYDDYIRSLGGDPDAGLGV
jgi:glutathione S-transferase